jgi:putative ABC transport system substrate-binding protein
VIQRAFQLLKEAIPGAVRVGYLFDPTSPTQVRSSAELRATAPALGIEYVGIEARAPEDFDEAFATVRRAHLGALYVSAGALARSQQARILDFVATERLPSMFGGSRDFVDAGGLFLYGEDLVEGVRRAVPYVDRIFKGAKPGDLPIEMTSKFVLIINMNTAKALGLTIPPSVLAQATELVQ